MAGSITAEDREFVERWEHISPQRWGIIRLDSRGDEKAEIIYGRQQFTITTEERIISQDRCRDPKLDPFLNGSFRPVIVPDSVTIETNPNALSDEEIASILDSSDLAFSEWLKEIDAVSTVRRMLDVAEETGEISVRRYRQLEHRLDEVRGEVKIESSDPALRKFLTDRPSLEEETGRTTVSGASNPRRRIGGMSSDYRDNR